MDSKPVLSGAASLASLEPTINAYTWSRSAGKRLFDVVFAGFCLLLTWPLMLLAALLIKCTSPGPVFFRQIRSGQDGKTFDLLKFRSMTHGRRNAGPGVTRQGDPRIFPAGRWLRKWKVDELPQFINVIRGEMSMVGPRPDLPEYMDLLSQDQREVLLLRPGITGAATVKFRNEEELLAQVPADELQQFYVYRLLPEKVRLELAYARQASLSGDLKILLSTVATILS
jgi:lipopolysaccharide/colanic/teichoic acid biosynthesis glycosyltransferase